jgi:hypothetical protein
MFFRDKGKKKAARCSRKKAKGSGLNGGDPLGSKPFMPYSFDPQSKNTDTNLAVLFTRSIKNNAER